MKLQVQRREGGQGLIEKTTRRLTRIRASSPAQRSQNGVKDRLTQKFLTLNPIQLVEQMQCWQSRLSKAIETWNCK